MLRTIFLIFVLLLISSCAAMVTHQTAINSLMDATPCCTSMAEFRYVPLSLDEPINFRLDKNSESFVFPTGKSYFKAFSLPNKKTPYRIRIKSFALGETIDKAHIFYPQLALLNSRFIVIKQSDPRDFTLMKAGMSETASVNWGLLMLKLDGSILDDISDARYLVVYTTKELMGKTSGHMAKQIQPIPVPIPRGIMTGALPEGEVPVNIPHSPFGWLSVMIEP